MVEISLLNNDLNLKYFAGFDFQWQDGIFSIALTAKSDKTGIRFAFFHAMASHGEFLVSTKVLRNETLSTRRTHGNDFKFIGQRGNRTNSAAHQIDTKTNVVFFAELQKNSVSCWNVRQKLNPENVHIIEQDDVTLMYPADLFVS